MPNTGIIGIVLIITNIIFSYKGFTNKRFFDSYKFEVDSILIKKDYKRLITSGFLHVSWLHLIFNMLCLYSFSGILENTLGEIKFLLIYLASLIGGEILSLFIHRNNGDYSSVGASGAIGGLIFSNIALFPGMSMGLFILPISIPGWLFGIAYVAISIYAIRSKKDNIGHEAHLGGALIGMAVALLMQPAAFAENYPTILIIAVPAIVFIYLILTRPHLLLIDNFYFNTHKNYYSVDHKYNVEKNISQQEVDRLLDKISKGGIKSLSREEKNRLRQHSQNVR